MSRGESEQELRALLKAGDAAAWRSVLELLTPQLLGYASRLLGDQISAEEVVQEAMVSVFRAIEEYEGRASIKSWLYKAVHNRAVDELRRRKRYTYADAEEVDQHAFGPGGQWVQPVSAWEDALGARIDARQIAVVVNEEIEKIPHDYRDVLLLKEVQGLDTEEICVLLDITPANLRVRLHRARRALRAAVDHHFSRD